MILEKEECQNCKYNNWDCKNCYIEDVENLDKGEFFPNLIFTIVLTRQCNFRCNYCVIDFSDDSISYKIIDRFILELLERRKQIGKIKFEFFGGEPLLELDKVKYIVSKTIKANIDYSIVTNGVFLDEDSLNFLNASNFEVVFSVALHTRKLLEEKKELLSEMDLSRIIINFIIEPGKERKMYNIFCVLIKMGFKKITILPAYYTVTWTKTNLSELDLLLRKISIIYYKILSSSEAIDLFYIRTNKESEYNVEKNDVEIMLDYNGKFYGDYDTELYLIKDSIPNYIFNIESILLGELEKDFFLLDIIIERKKIRTVMFMDIITSFLGVGDNVKALGEVIKKNNVNYIGQKMR